MSAAEDPISSIRLTLLQQGYEPIPIVGPDAPGQSPGKRPILSGWQTIEISPDEVREWRRGRYRDCTNTGIRTGLLVAIDIDVLEPVLSDRLQDLALKVFGTTPLRRIGKAPKSLLCYRVAETIPKAETPEFILPDGTKAQIEVLAKGQQFVAYGIHPDTRTEYEWPEAGPDVVPLHDLPSVRADAIKAYLASAEVLIREAGGRSVKEIEAEEKAAREPPRQERAERSARQDGSDFFRNVNTAALRDADRWIKRLFPAAYWQPNATTPPGAWRVHSKDLGRGLEEDISVHPAEGCQDFGTREKMTCIDLVMEHGGAPDAVAAAFLLCEWLGVAPETLGWRAGRQDGFREAPGGAETSAGEPRRRGRPKRAEEPPEGVAWQSPVDFLAEDEATGAPELRPEHVPAVIWDFAQDTAGRMGVDPASVVLSCLVTCASVITDDWRIQPKRFDTEWDEQARIWGGIVGPPSVLKTPILKAATKPVNKVEMRARKEHQEAMERYKAAHKAWKDAKGEAVDEPRRPRAVRYIVGDTTVEKLGELLRDDPESQFNTPARKVLVFSDELAELLGSFERYKGTGGGDRQAYLRLYNGGPHPIDRVNRGSFIVPNWSACLLGGLQPDVFQEIVKKAKEDGLMQRFIFCVPNETGEGEDRAPNAAALARYSNLIEALTALTPPTTAFGGTMATVVLHQDAHRHREGMATLARAMMGMPDCPKRLKAAYGKWTGLFARMALIFHLIEAADTIARTGSRPDTQILSEATARMAAAYMEDILLPHLLRADAVIYSTEQTGHARWIARFIMAKKLKIVTVRDVAKVYADMKAPEMGQELRAIMDSLVTLGWLLPTNPEVPARERTAWWVNPMVQERFGARGEAEMARREKARTEMAELIRRRKEARN